MRETQTGSQTRKKKKDSIWDTGLEKRGHEQTAWQPRSNLGALFLFIYWVISHSASLLGAPPEAHSSRLKHSDKSRRVTDDSPTTALLLPPATGKKWERPTQSGQDCQTQQNSTAVLKSWNRAQGDELTTRAHTRTHTYTVKKYRKITSITPISRLSVISHTRGLHWSNCAVPGKQSHLGTHAVPNCSLLHKKTGKKKKKYKCKDKVKTETQTKVFLSSGKTFIAHMSGSETICTLYTANAN